MHRLARNLTGWLFAGLGLLVLWQAVVWVTAAPPYILPAPWAVAETLLAKRSLLIDHLMVTVLEILLGLVFGTVIGVTGALAIAYFRPARRWLLPVLVASQAIPVFALAPLLVLWLGYGIASKVAMATLIIFFPVTAAFGDGLRRTESGWVDLARTMIAAPTPAAERRRRLAILFHIRIPAALPALASGLRVAAAVAPIGAVVGEWVGASAGIGFLMLHANGRMQIDLMFAALFVLAVFAVLLWFTLDVALRALVPWQPETISELEDS